MQTSKTSLIVAENLTKEFKVSKREEGFFGAIKYLLSRKYHIVKAVDNINFEIDQAEMVGYIGRNGAGKSTTIKMLTGILVPTCGKVEVDGIVPYKQRSENGKRIGVVFGQRTQLRWDIPVIESFRFLKEVYQIPQEIYKKNLKFFSDILELNDLLSTPVRKLSLGQRMKCDLAVAFLHNPKIVYLDEPTIGLDIVVKEKVRAFIKTVNRELGTTIILTTHDLRDIDDICDRIIIVDAGNIIYDGGLQEIKHRYGQYRVLTFEVKGRRSEEETVSHFPQGMELLESAEHTLKVRIILGTISAAEAAHYIMEKYDVIDVNIEDPSIESVVQKIYQQR